MEFRIGSGHVELVQGDITKEKVDGIVNAANSRLVGGGGVDGAIRAAGGPQISKECRRIGGCPTGSAVPTLPGNLETKYVIHAVGPIWKDGKENEASLLVSAYRRCLEIADELGLRTIAFPSISTGVYGFPIEQAARLAITAVRDYLIAATTQIEVVRFVLFSEGDLQVYGRAAIEFFGPQSSAPKG